MRAAMLAGIGIAVVLAAACGTLARAPATPAAAAASRAIPLLQHTMDAWFEERTCTSCHHHSLGVMALSFAAERGLPIDSTRLAAQVARLANPPDGFADALQLHSGINPAIGRGYQLTALGAAAHPADERTDAMAHVLASLPADDGVFPSDSHRPPHEDSHVTATALASHALQLYAAEGRTAEAAARIAAAGRWLLHAKPADTEDRTMRLFGLRWTGVARVHVDQAKAELLATQHADGGFAQLDGDASDAYATATALVALQQAGDLATDTEAYRRGVAWLLAHQEADGSWHVPTRRRGPGLEPFDTGFPHGEDQFLSCAATSWAVMALAATIDPRPSVVFHGPRPGRSSAPGSLPPLLAAAAFGSAADLEQALPNAAVDTPGPGGITALGLAVHDADKVRRLLAAGARVDARTERGMTPLALAASAGTPETIQLLLGAGADPNAADREGSPLLLFAAATGDERKVQALLRAGADPRATMHGIGLAHIAAWIGDRDMVQLAIAAGADPDARSQEPDHGTPLHNAAADGQFAAVAALVAGGATVDAPDGEGMTPLAWAARVRRGNDHIAAVLLDAGADPDFACKDGTTPRAWAQREGNAAVLARMQPPASARQPADRFVPTAAADGPAKGLRIVFVTGDEEYRSEESMPQLARILARLGADCTVLFAIDAATGTIDPTVVDHLPGLEALAAADLLVLFTRFRALPDAAMQHLADHVGAGRPIVALRTSTHAFAPPPGSRFADWAWNAPDGGFGRRVLGETWIAHHGKHGEQGTRGIVATGAAAHPVLCGVDAADVWDPADVYRVRLPLPADCTPLLLGDVLQTMAKDAPPLADQGERMPIAWVRELPAPHGPQRVFTTTLGAAEAFRADGTRRLLVNACLWAAGRAAAIRADLDVRLVGEYSPGAFGFGKHRRGARPADLSWPVAAPDAGR